MILSEGYIKQICSGHLKWSEDLAVVKLEHGSMAFIYEIIAGESSFIFKAYPVSRQSVAKKEFDVLKQAGQSPVKIPKLIANGVTDDFSYIIYEKIPGESLNFGLLGDKNKQIISQQIADNLFQISKIPFRSEGFGSLTEDEPAYDSWKDFLIKNIASGLENLEKFDSGHTFPLNVIERFMYDFLNSYKENSCGLVWSDFSQENIIVADNNLTGFIDFEGCFYGDPMLSLGYLYAKEGDSEFFRYIKAAMKSLIEIPNSTVYFYALLRLLRISKYLSEPLPGGHTREPILNYFKGLKESFKFIERNQNLMT
jgi:aminoglycoside phosphotransferase (APT) family kinase protein